MQPPSKQDPRFWALIKCFESLMLEASRGGLSYTTALSGVRPAVEMGNYSHREATLVLPPVVFMLSKAPPLRKRVAESGRALGRPADSTAGGHGVPCASKLKIWQPKSTSEGWSWAMGCCAQQRRQRDWGIAGTFQREYSKEMSDTHVPWHRKSVPTAQSSRNPSPLCLLSLWFNVPCLSPRHLKPWSC